MSATDAPILHEPTEDPTEGDALLLAEFGRRIHWGEKVDV